MVGAGTPDDRVPSCSRTDGRVDGVDRPKQSSELRRVDTSGSKGASTLPLASSSAPPRQAPSCRGPFQGPTSGLVRASGADESTATARPRALAVPAWELATARRRRFPRRGLRPCRDEWQPGVRPPQPQLAGFTLVRLPEQNGRALPIWAAVHRSPASLASLSDPIKVGRT